MNKKQIWNQLDSDTQQFVRDIVSTFFPESGRLPHPPEINPPQLRRCFPVSLEYTNMAKDAKWRDK